MTNMKKVAFITGGSSGIGLGVAEALLKEGYRVAITSRSAERAEEVASSLRTQFGHAVSAFALDVRNYEQQVNVLKTVVARWGRLDVVIANAGVGHFANIEDISLDIWSETIDTNLTGPFYTIKAALPFLKESKGYIITISSLAGTNFFNNGAAYNASKFGLTGFTQAVMLDLRDKGIKVSTIMPGSVATAFDNHVVDASDSWKIQKEDIGALVVDLLQMHPRTLPSKIEVRPSCPPKK